MLTPQETAFLDQHGYLNLGQLLSTQEVNAVNDRLEAIMQEEGDRAGAELAESKHIRHPKEEGADRLADLVNKGSVFDIFYTHPRVLAAIEFEYPTTAGLSGTQRPCAEQVRVIGWEEAPDPHFLNYQISISCRVNLGAKGS
jgi:hypothetical protein